MKPLLQFVRTTLLGGLLVVLPVWLTVVVLWKLITAALVVLQPIAALLPQHVLRENLAALVLLLAICFVTGLLARTRPAKRFGLRVERQFLVRVPGYVLLRGMTRGLAGQADEQSFQPALVELEDALVPAFIVEKHADGQFTVFVSSSPTPMAGTIYILPPARVHPVDVPVHRAMVCITEWGAGTGRWLAARRTKSSNTTT